MKAVLYPATPNRIKSIMTNEKIFFSIGKSMNETARPMEVALYETKNSGGSGKIVAVLWIGPGHEFQKRSVDHVKAMAYCPEHTFSASQIGGKKMFFYEILFKQYLTPAKEIREVVWRGSIKPPRVWKFIEI